MLAALVAAAAVSGAAAPKTRLTFGAGSESCEAWLASPGATIVGVNWLFGYWSGLNAATDKRTDIGSSLSAQQIIQSVKDTCAQYPGSKLMNATASAYIAAELKELKGAP